MRIQLLCILLLASSSSALCQKLNQTSLAKLLANPAKRSQGIEMSRQENGLWALLDLTHYTPKGVDQEQLLIGLADAFRELKPLEAIPFLIANIDLARHPARYSPWLKTEDIVVEAKASIAALIAIGPPASRALIALWPSFENSYRTDALYAITHIPDEQSRSFLTTILAEAVSDLDRVPRTEERGATWEAYWCRNALANLDRAISTRAE